MDPSPELLLSLVMEPPAAEVALAPSSDCGAELQLLLLLPNSGQLYALFRLLGAGMGPPTVGASTRFLLLWRGTATTLTVFLSPG